MSNNLLSNQFQGNPNVRRYLSNTTRKKLRSVAEATGLGRFIPRGQDRLFREFMNLLEETPTSQEQFQELFEQGLQYETIKHIQPLLYAIKTKNKPLFDILLDNNVVDINEQDLSERPRNPAMRQKFPYLGKQYTPLLFSLHRYNTFLDELLSKGADPNVGNNEELPLFSAIKKFDIQAMQKLLEKGANPNRVFKETAPLLLALEKVNEKKQSHNDFEKRWQEMNQANQIRRVRERAEGTRGIFGRLANTFLGNRTVHQPRPYNFKDIIIVQQLLDDGAKLESQDYPIQPLALAVRLNNVGLVEYLLKEGADKDYVHKGKKAIDFLRGENEETKQKITSLLSANYDMPTRPIPPNTDNAVSYNTIRDGNMMANFQNEASFGRYYKRGTVANILKYRNPKNPFTSKPLQESNVSYYKASVSSQGGKSKTRKGKKSLTK